MGDTGSMALGGAISAMAIFSRSVLLLAIMGGCFVASSVSCILQVGSYKLRKKRIFKMAPLHHHFELLGLYRNAHSFGIYDNYRTALFSVPVGISIKFLFGRSVRAGEAVVPWRLARRALEG